MVGRWRGQGGWQGRRRPACRASTVLLVALAAVLTQPALARGSHEPIGPCSPGFENVRGVDLETFFDGRSNLTICLGANLQGLDGDVQWSNMSHVTVRSAPGSHRMIRSRIWIDQTNSNVTLYGLTLSSSVYSGPAGYGGIAINGDSVTLRRNLVTNGYGTAGSCIIADGGYGIPDDTVIAANKVYDCGRDEVHDHGIYTNYMNRPVVTANWIYENAGRGINLGPQTHNGRFTRNVIVDNCADPLGGANDCSGNVMYWGFSSSNAFNTNTVAFPRHRWGLSGCDFSPDTPSCYEWGGSDNVVERSCFYSTVSGYSGDPANSGISPGWNTKFGSVDAPTITVADPQFTNRTTSVHAWRNYRIPAGSPCAAYQPQGGVGAPAP
jgi:hypothetical protein